jgi:hypothetical protein
MRRANIGLTTIATFVVAAVLSGAALGSPAIDSAIINPRVWNDFPASTLVTVNNYPTLISIGDGEPLSAGFANRHNFRLSADGGVLEAVFMNGDYFQFAADVTITGTAHCSGGLNVSPWWSQEVDGVLSVDTATGEIAAWGGRLPFYSFTVSQGLTYTVGGTVRLGVIYDPHSLTGADPATIEYLVTQGATTYTSGALAFDQGNPAEDPPYGLWGMLNDARVGGFFQVQLDISDPRSWGQIVFENITYSPIPEPSVVCILLFGVFAVLLRRAKTHQ